MARIDEHYLSGEIFNEVVRDRLEETPGKLPPQMVSRFEQRVLNSVIEQHLIDTVLDEEDVDVTKDEIDAAYEAFAAEFDDRDSLEAALESMELTPEEMRRELKDDVKIEKYVDQNYGLEVTEEELRTYFEEQSHRYGTPEQVEARHILITLDEDADESEETGALARAEDIYEEAIADADFGQLARERSEGPSAHQGGELSRFSRPTMVQEFSDVAFDELEIGEISEPVRTEFGYHIIEKLAHHDAQQPDFEALRPELEEKLSHQKRVEAFNRFHNAELEGSEIEKYWDNIERNVE